MESRTIPANLDANSSIVVVVDMQNDYVHPDGAFAKMGHDTSSLISTLGNIRELIQLAKKLDVPVVYVRQTHSHWFNTDGWVGRGKGGRTLQVTTTPLVVEGSWGAEFHGVTPESDDLVITKHRYDAFQYTPLELVFHAKKRNTAILCGGTTDCCVRYTGVGAVTRGISPILIGDCAATNIPGAYEFNLREFSQHIGLVMSLAELKRSWLSEQHKRGNQAS